MAAAAPGETLVPSLARLLQDSGDLVLDGTSTLTLLTSTLQHLTQVFEQHLVSRNQNHGFVALPSHPADTSTILQAQFLFDILQKTLSLKTLTELEYLNLAYNFLPKVPNLGLYSQTKLVTLILRNNELDSINGVEQLLNLQHLDVAYNLLLEHAQLAPLSMLHNMRKLHLEGNPLWFHQNHRSATIIHLSPRAASFSLLLDGELLTTSDLMHLPKSGQVIAQSIHSSTSEKTLLDRSALDSSCFADLSDSQSPGESGAARLPQRKSKGNVRVRRPSISEPSDTEHEYQALPSSAGMVLRHQKEMERMDAFRDHFGADWLQYKRQLEEHDREETVSSFCCPAKEVPGSLPGTDIQSESTTQEQETPSGLLRDTFLPLDSMREEEEEEKEPQLEESLGESCKGEMDADELAAQEEEEKPEVDLCQPVLVSQIEGDGDPEPDWIFLRITAQHVIEVELKAARVVHKLELRSLQKVETSEMTWRRMDLERVFPVLTLHFSYIRKDRRKRRYVVLDDHPELCMQCVLRVLSPALEENRRLQGVEEGSMKLQCLKCKQEFAQPLTPWQQSPYPAEAEGGKGMETSAQPNQEAAAPGEPMVCPSCSSDHVVLLPCERHSSAPLPPQRHTDKPLSEPGPQGSLEAASVLGSQSGQFYIGGEDDSSETDPRTQELSGDHGSTIHSSSDGDGRRKELGLKSCYSSLSRTDTSAGSLMGSYHYGASRGPTPSQLSLNSESEETWNLSPREQSRAAGLDLSTNCTLDVRDFRSVDHRLRLYLDMEVFEENVEEFQCFLKVAMVKFGRYGEFPALLVASDLRIHVLEVTGEIRGQPADWLKKNDSHYLSDLCYLEMGLGHQSLQMEFENPKASYNLLIRNQSRCDQFLQCLTYLLQELPSKHRSRVTEICTVEMSPQHRLWPLLEKALCSVAVDCTSSRFFYLLAYLIQGASAFPVTLLSTFSTLLLLEENHQWQRVQPTPGAAGEREVPPESGVQLKEKQPISSISSVITYRFSPCDVKLMFYDEVLKVESVWHIHTECPELLAQLVEWIRSPWEEMFSIDLRKTVQEVPE
ncbi:serine/threonine-protein kinase 11-interacting protein isoform X3 [Caretta caretta]|uniref:serine/threonine-protein kinase 11-interacting protein isoform X3 n=1 Tax=Caretta caretta TaxID=8467 RepID=UPI0020955AAC|nr:serine/threonine-protein kinase 11-interacting protein isoform X5 [Caretta caretta]